MRTCSNGAAPRRSGKVVVLLAVCMVGVLGVLALSLDGGYLLDERRQAQAAADAAALAAACELFENYWTESGADPNGTARASALLTAAANRYTNDGVNSKVEVYIPPISGDYIGQVGYVEVLVTYYHERGFSSLFGSGKIAVGARAVALGAPIAGDVGILVLDPDDKSAFNASGGGVTDVRGTPVVVNSTSQEGTIVNGGSVVKADEFFLTGNWTTTGGGTLVGDVYTDRRPMEDPLTWLPVPDTSTMIVRSNSKLHAVSGALVLLPGLYKGGISVGGTASLTLMPGIYYMDHGGFSFTGQGSLIGNGVMIYNDPGNGQNQGIEVSGQGLMQISPMTTGIYAGLTFWQRRDADVTGSIAGNGSNTQITGTFYFPGSLLNISGNGGLSNIGSQYISRLLNISGNGGIQISWSPDKVAKRKTIELVE